jgi:hypothetical protein
MNLVIHALTFILYLAYLIFLGRLVLSIIVPPHRGQNIVEWGPTAFMLSSGVLCVLVLPLSILHVKTHLWMLLATGGIMAGAAAIFKHKPEHGASIPWNKYECLAFGIFALLLTANFLMVSAYPQFDIDMIGHIIMKAKIISDSSYAGAAYFQDPVFASAHNNYPPLTVFLHSFMALLGLNSTADYQALNYIIIFFIGLTLHASLRSRIGILQGLIWSFILISTGEYLKNQFLISSTDIYFALAILLTALAFLNTKIDANAGENILFSILCACTLLIKNDAILFIGLITLGLWIKIKRLPMKHLLIIAILTGPWMIYRMTLPNPEAGAEFMLRHFSNYLLPQNFQHLVQIVISITTHNLNLIFILSLCTWPLLFRQKDLHILMACIFLTAFAYIILVWGAIPISFNDEAPGLMRLWSQFYPLMLFITALSLNTLVKPDQH